MQSRRQRHSHHASEERARRRNEQDKRVLRSAVVFLHAMAGWAFCGTLIGILRSVVSLQATLIVHAVGAPLGFTLISRFYFRRFAYTTPLQTAVAFLLVVVGLDAFLVAPFIEKSFLMFRSPVGTWLPFALIFVATYITGSRTLSQRRPPNLGP